MLLYKIRILYNSGDIKLYEYKELSIWKDIKYVIYSYNTKSKNTKL